jgi:hypothetical protein
MSSVAADVGAHRSIFSSGHSHYHSAVQNVSEQILEDHLPLPVIEKSAAFASASRAAMTPTSPVPLRVYTWYGIAATHQAAVRRSTDRSRIGLAPAIRPQLTLRPQLGMTAPNIASEFSLCWNVTSQAAK